MSTFAQRDEISHSGSAIPIVAQFAARPAKSQNKNWHDLPKDDLEVLWIDDISELKSMVVEWNRLAECSLCPNIFYEPQMLIPAIEQLSNPNVRIAVVRAPQRNQPNAAKVICGLFPLELSASRIPVRTAKFWQHMHCFLATPLVRADAAELTLKRFIEFIRDDAGISLLHMNHVAGEGAFQRAMIELINENQLAFWTKQSFQRALFVPQENEGAFFDQWPRKRRHEVGRHERRLCEMGNVTVNELQQGDCPTHFADGFLRLESMSWKGQAGTAMNGSPQQTAFLRQSFARLAEDKKLMGLTLAVDGIPIATKANLLTHQGGFAFKIAYDPEFAKFSPGVVLEKANISRLHETNRVKWMDSCAAPNHPMINCLWPQRRVLQSIILATDAKGNALVAAYPMAKYVRNVCRSIKRKLSKPACRLSGDG
jgi:CelD/BcsL family acetyltransferase involved in cellulose biosynthesis